MGYSNINATPNYQLQGFGQSGMRTISTSQAYVEGEYYRVLVATQDSTISATSVIGDDITDLQVYAGTTIYGLFTAVSVSVGEVTAYLAGATDIESVWSYINTYGLNNGAIIEAADCAKDAIEPLLDKYYAQASLVLVPSLYKTSVVYAERPLDANGQLTFTRASNATRVGPDGYIEKVRTNLALHSNNFSNAAWTNLNLTLTSGQVGYDGTNSAWLIAFTAGASRALGTSVLPAGIVNFSFYVKAGTHNFIQFTTSTSANIFANFNISAGSPAVGTKGSLVLNSSITSVGNGWYRCSMACDNPSSGTIFMYMVDSESSARAGVVSTDGNILIQDAQLETGDIATDYIPTTTTAVSVGPVSNLPRLDYPINADGSVGCPSLLLEPQRTNLVTFSEQLDNAAWTKTNCTVLANQTSSPSGYVDADEVTTTSTLHALFAVATVTASTAYTFSFYVKRGTMTDLAYRVFNITAGTNIVAPTSYYSQTTASGWSRITLTFTTPVGCTSARVDLIANSGVTGTVYFWGAQLEAGAYATSYIPTLGASVTRVDDACSKTGISSLIGQTEGTLFLEVEVIDTVTSTRQLQISDGTSNNRIQLASLSGNFTPAIVTSGVVQASLSVAIPSGVVKIALAYALNDIAFYLNGSSVGTDTSATIPACSRLDLGGALGSNIMTGGIRSAILFPTRLTNQQLQELTSL